LLKKKRFDSIFFSSPFSKKKRNAKMQQLFEKNARRLHQVLTDGPKHRAIGDAWENLRYSEYIGYLGWHMNEIYLLCEMYRTTRNEVDKVSAFYEAKEVEKVYEKVWENQRRFWDATQLSFPVFEKHLRCAIQPLQSLQLNAMSQFAAFVTSPETGESCSKSEVIHRYLAWVSSKKHEKDDKEEKENWPQESATIQVSHVPLRTLGHTAKSWAHLITDTLYPEVLRICVSSSSSCLIL
jgi:hypothetical protein